MKIGTQTGSLINHLQSRMTKGQPEPMVGMGATVLCYTDRKPATIIEVFLIGRDVAVKIQIDGYKRLDNNGLSEVQEYEFFRDTEAPVYYYKFHNGAWRQCAKNRRTNRWNSVDGNGLRIGTRDKYHDPHF